MSNCPQCRAPVAPGSRFCTECGRPLTAGPAPVPPMHMPNQGMPPVPPPMPNQGMPPVPPPMPNQGMPPVPPPVHAPRPNQGMPPVPPPFQNAVVPPVPPTMNRPPVPPAPVAQNAAAATIAAPAAGLGLAPGEVVRVTACGDLFNAGEPIAVLATDERVLLIAPGAAPKVEAISGARHLVIGDYDGDGTQELAVITDTHVWPIRFGPAGSVPGGRCPIQELPLQITKAPFTSDGRTVLMSVTAHKISFCVLHPARGLVEIAAVEVPAIEP